MRVFCTLAILLVAIPAGEARPGLASQEQDAGLALGGVVRVPDRGEPFVGANVELRDLVNVSEFDPQGVKTEVTTDGGGRFTFGDLAPGPYQVRPFVMIGDERINGLTTTLTLKAGSLRPDLQLWMPRVSMISGRVRQEDGAVVEGATIALRASRWNRGRRVLVRSARTATTGPEGRYEFPAFPGEYYVQVSPPPDRSGEFPPFYYPNAIDPGDGVPLHVAGGVDLTGVDVVLRRTDSYRVRFRLELARELKQVVTDGSDAAPIQVRIRRVDGRLSLPETELIRLETVSTDTWRTGPLPPGEYDFVFEYAVPAANYLARQSGNPQSAVPPVAQRRLTIEDADLDLGTITPGAAAVLVGRTTARLSPAGREVADGLRFAAMFVDVDNLLPWRVDLAPGETFRFDDVSQGLHRFLTTELPSGWYVASVTSVGRDVLRDGLSVNAGSNPVEVVLADGAAQVEGVVRNTIGDLVQSARVVLVPPATRRGSQTRLPTVVADMSGAFAIGNVPPGEYRIMALDSAGLEATYRLFEGGVGEYWEDPVFLSGVERRGERVVLDPGDQRAVVLRAISMP